MARETHEPYDSVFLHARRETVVLLIGFSVFLLWSVSVSYVLGYGQTEEEARRTVLGIPHWAFWGVAVPWLAADAFTFWFCLFYMQDDPLGEPQEEDATESAQEEPS